MLTFGKARRKNITLLEFLGTRSPCTKKRGRIRDHRFEYIEYNLSHKTYLVALLQAAVDLGCMVYSTHTWKVTGITSGQWKKNKHTLGLSKNYPGYVFMCFHGLRLTFKMAKILFSGQTTGAPLETFKSLRTQALESLQQHLSIILSIQLGDAYLDWDILSRSKYSITLLGILERPWWLLWMGSCSYSFVLLLYGNGLRPTERSQRRGSRAHNYLN